MDNVMLQEILDSFKQDLDKSVNHLKSEYQILRAGRANPHILDRITVDYYGTPTPLNQMSNIAVAEARMITVSMWDISMLREAKKAIEVADLGVSVSDDGRIIRLIFPVLTEERRREIAKQVKSLLENCKISMRSARRDALDMFKTLKKDGEMSEDEYAGAEKDIQKIIDSYVEKVDEMCAAKEKEIMEV